MRYDPERTSIAELKRWVEERGYHCAGKSVPGHICSPLEEVVPNTATGGAISAGSDMSCQRRANGEVEAT